jgi:UDPglucose 6-dehydrogenase/GDP-mannose 6-dehydrogenase
VAAAAAVGVKANLLDAVLGVNERRPRRLLSLIGNSHPTLAGLEVTVLGLAFKPDTDDVRMTPAFPVIRMLVEAGASVATHDPVVPRDAIPAELRERVRHYDDLPAAIKGADVVVIVTRWDEYLALPALLQSAKKQPLVVDGRRMLQPQSVARYAGIGHPGPAK